MHAQELACFGPMLHAAVRARVACESNTQARVAPAPGRLSLPSPGHRSWPNDSSPHLIAVAPVSGATGRAPDGIMVPTVLPAAAAAAAAGVGAARGPTSPSRIAAGGWRPPPAADAAPPAGIPPVLPLPVVLPPGEVAARTSVERPTATGAAMALETADGSIDVIFRTLRHFSGREESATTPRCSGSGDYGSGPARSRNGSDTTAVVGEAGTLPCAPPTVVVVDDGIDTLLTPVHTTSALYASPKAAAHVSSPPPPPPPPPADALPPPPPPPPPHAAAPLRASEGSGGSSVSGGGSGGSAPHAAPRLLYPRRLSNSGGAGAVALPSSGMGGSARQLLPGSGGSYNASTFYTVSMLPDTTMGGTLPPALSSSMSRIPAPFSASVRGTPTHNTARRSAGREWATSQGLAEVQEAAAAAAAAAAATPGGAGRPLAYSTADTATAGAGAGLASRPASGAWAPSGHGAGRHLLRFLTATGSYTMLEVTVRHTVSSGVICVYRPV